MGYAEVPLDSPEKFLKIGGGVHAKRPKKDHVCYQKVLPPIPKQDKKKDDKKGESKDNAKDFKKNNIEAAVKSAPVRQLPRYVDTKNGDFHDLKKSGLMPLYVYQPKFGKLPKYLIKRIRDAAAQEELFRDEEVRKQPLCRYVTQEERAELLGVLNEIRVNLLYIIFLNNFLGIKTQLGRTTKSLSRFASINRYYSKIIA